jgi:hypothetical protein
MNCGATTAFLPNFVGFPSPRGLHSSTVQPRRAPGARHKGRGAVTSAARPRGRDQPPPARGRGPSLDPRTPTPPRPHAPTPPAKFSCVSAASAAPPAAPAGRPASAGRASPARRVPAARVPPVVTAGRTAATGRRSPGPAGPPAAGAVRPAPRAAAGGRTRRALREPDLLAAADGGTQRHDEQDEDDRQDEADEHGVTLLSFPRSDPPWAPRFLRARGMPSRLTRQSRVEEVQSFGAG